MNLPFELLPHEDKVLYNEGAWLITDGIDHVGNPIPEAEESVSVLYLNYGFYFYMRASKEMYEDKSFFWKWVRSIIASKICQLRKEIEK